MLARFILISAISGILYGSLGFALGLWLGGRSTETALEQPAAPPAFRGGDAVANLDRP